MPVNGAGIEKETEGVTLVSTRHSPRQFPFHPYSGRKERMKGSCPARMPPYGTVLRGRDPGLYAPQPPQLLQNPSGLWHDP